MAFKNTARSQGSVVRLPEATESLGGPTQGEEKPQFSGFLAATFTPLHQPPPVTTFKPVPSRA